MLKAQQRRNSVAKSYRFTIPVRPKSKGRPRVTSKNGKQWAYTPKSTRDWEETVRHYYKGPKFEGPVSMSIVLSTKRAIVTVTAMDVEPSPLRGDISNYVKGIEDALNGIAYDDDRQIHRLVGKKK